MSTDNSHLTLPFNPIDWQGKPHDYTGNDLLGLHTAETTQRYTIGTRHITWDGRVYKYCLAYALARSYYGACTTATHAYAGEALVSSVAVGDKFVTVTETGFTENELRGGFICVYGASDNAMNRMIVGNDASATTTTKIFIDGPITTAGDTLYHEVFQNPYKYISSVALNYACCVCVPAVNIVAGSYGWGQTWGPCVVTPAEDVGTRAVGQDNMVFDDSNGVRKTNAAADTYRQKAGFLLNQGITTYGPLIMLQISV